MTSSGYAKKEAEDKAKARDWLSNLLGLDVQDDFFAELGDGVLLCSIVNTIKPGTIKKVNPSGRCKKLIVKKMENINNFLLGARRIGVFNSYLFEVDEFVAQKRLDKLIRCLLKLEEIAKKNGINVSEAGEIVLELQKKVEEEDLIRQQKDEAERREREERERREEKEREAQERKEIEEYEKRRREELARIASEHETHKNLIKEKQAAAEARFNEEREKREREARETAERRERARNEREEREKKEKAERDKKLAALSLANKEKASSSFSSEPRRLTGVDAILYWAQTTTSGYEGVDIKDFTHSWKDGLAFCALVSHYFPKEVDYKSCLSKSPLERLEIAFDAAGRMGVPPLLDPEDVNALATPDRRSIITYLSCLYKGFRR